MHISRSFPSLLWAAFAVSSAQANYIVDSLSFGHRDTISKDRSTIPGWSVSGEGHNPQILSDRIILTPPYPGNKRGSLWATNPLDKDEFVADLEFRASGQDRGNGNLQIWLTQGGQPKEGGINSIYTVGQFDGLVLSIDQYGGQGGKIRGFLNDGTISFKDHHSVDSLAFGQCDYPFRNRGDLSHLKITQTGEIFLVEVNDKRCFATNKVSLPAGYYFGVSASSAENPDSFEAFKFTVSTTDAHAREEVRRNNRPPPPPPPQQQQQQPVQPPPASAPPSPQQDQINDLSSRLQIVSQQVDNIYRLLQDMQTRQEQRHSESMSLGRNGPVQDRVGNVERMVGKIEGMTMAIQRDLEGKDYKEHLANLQKSLKDTQSGLTDSLSHIVTTSAPKMWTFFFLVIIFQVVMFGSYLVYKRRRDNAPKKYL